MDEASLKRKLRALKKLEIKTRFRGTVPEGVKLVWDGLFDTKGAGCKNVRYSFKDLITKSKEELKQVNDVFFSMLYYEYYKENGITFPNNYDVKLLDGLGLTADSGEKEIKERFRLLAKKYHPDMGGDSAKFIELMNVYCSLTGK